MKKLLPVLCALTFLLPATGLSQNTDKNQSGLSQNKNQSDLSQNSNQNNLSLSQSDKNQRAKEAAAAAGKAAAEAKKAAAAEAAETAARAEEVKNANPQIQGQSGSDLSHSHSYSNAAATAANAGNSEAAYDNARRALYDTPEARKKSASTSGGDWTSKISPRDIDNDPGLSSQQKEDLKEALAYAQTISAQIKEISAQIKKEKKKLKDKIEREKYLEEKKENLSNDPRADFVLLNQYKEENKKEITKLNESINKLNDSIKDKQTKLDGIKRRLRDCNNCKPAHQ